MHSRLVSLKNDNLKIIYLSNSPYHQTENYITLVIKESYLQNNPSFIDKIKDKCNTDIVTKTAKIDSFVHIYISNPDNLKALICLLDDSQLINEDDMSKIDILVKENDAHQKESQSTGELITQGQENLLLSVVDVYIDAILEQLMHYKPAVALLRCAFSKHFLEEKEFHHKLLKSSNIDVSILDSVEALWKICNGQANLEGTFLRVNDVLPSLDKQRQSVYNSCIRALNAKFKLIDKEDKELLFLYLNMLIGKDNPDLPSTVHFDNHIIKCLLHKPNTSLKEFHVMLGENLSRLKQAFIEMGIIKNQFDYDMERLVKLQKLLNSPILEALIKQIKEAENDKLSHCLTRGDREQIQIVFADKLSLNGFLNSGHTPLIFSVQYCPLETVKVLLSLKPEIDNRDKSNAHNALAAAITLNKTNVVLELVKHGASLFKHCGMVRKNLMGSMMFTILELTPMQYATELFEDNYALKDVLKLMFRKGAGIGCILNEKTAALLEDGMVVIGAANTKLSNCKLITNAQQFKELIGVDEYSYWISVFNDAMKIPYTSGRYDEMRSELKELIHYMQSKLMLKEVSTSIANLSISSPITESGNTHNLLFNKIKAIINGDSSYASILESLDGKQYDVALRKCCVNSHPTAEKIAQELLNNKSTLGIDLNERSSTKNKSRTALHYAALNKNKNLYMLLLSHGADKTLVDDTGISAEIYFNKIHNEVHKVNL